jgi:hypothetical protein
MAASNFQRVGSISNTHAGREFEACARAHFARQGLDLIPNFPVDIGYGSTKRHRFDLGSDDPPVLVECKSNTWTETGNSPSAKIKGMNEVMLYFSVAPLHYRKVLFVLRHMKGELSLAAYYVRTQGHLIPAGVEVWEYCTISNKAFQLV